MIALVQSAASAERVHRTISEVLGDDHYHAEKSALGKWIERILNSIATLFGVGSGAVGWTVVVVLAVIVIAVLVRAVRSSRRNDAATAHGREPERADPRAARRARIRELRSQAREAESRGEHLLALRLEFTALVVGLGERGDLEYRDAFTNRELLERGRPDAAARSVLAPLVPMLDAKSFGGEPATARDVADLAAQCDRLLAELAR